MKYKNKSYYEFAIRRFENAKVVCVLCEIVQPRQNAPIIISTPLLSLGHKLDEMSS